MDVVHPRCCGLDVHKQTVVACILLASPSGPPQKLVRTFGTLTDELLALGDWLTSESITHVALEATGSYWKAVWNMLEGRFELLLVNTQHIKAVPGRKTDVKDAEWIAELLRHGLLKPSFVRDRPQRELRELTRYRTSLIQERAAEVNRLQKVLEGANLKIGDVATDVLGRSARQMLEAIVGGATEADAATLAQLARGRLREKIPHLERALAGRVAPHQRFLLAQQLAHIDFLDETIERVSSQIAERLCPFDESLANLDAIPGVGRRTAETLLAEIGTDMTRFPSPAQLASWAGMCPGTPRGWQASQWQDAQGEPSTTPRADRSGTRRRPLQEHLPGCSVPSTRGTPGRQAGGRCRGPLDPQHRLALAPARIPVPRPGRQLL